MESLEPTSQVDASRETHQPFQSTKLADTQFDASGNDDPRTLGVRAASMLVKRMSRARGPAQSQLSLPPDQTPVLFQKLQANRFGRVGFVFQLNYVKRDPKAYCAVKPKHHSVSRHLFCVQRTPHSKRY